MSIFWTKEDHEGGIAIPFICVSAMLTLGFLYFVDDYYHRNEIINLTTDGYLYDVLLSYGKKDAETVKKGEVKTVEYTIGTVIVDKQDEHVIYSISCYLTSGYGKKAIFKYDK